MTILNKQDKWLLVSCLQKSIRKGHLNLALNYADELYEIEKAYLLYRLSIIAVEDIGLGNIDVVHNFLETEIKKKIIEERGGKPYVMQVVHDLTLANKDRSACDLTYLSSFYENEIKTIEKEELENVFINSKECLVRRVIAGWEVLGSNKQKNPFIQNKEDDVQKFILLNEKITKDKKILDIISASYKFQREPHFIALGLLKFVLDEEIKQEELIGKYKVGSVVQKSFTPLMCGLRNKWLIDGIDWHTAEGKRAIYQFMNIKSPLLDYVKEHSKELDREVVAHGIGNLLFRENGHCVDKRLIYPSAISILRNCISRSIRQRFGKDFDPSTALKLMHESSPILYQIIEDQMKKPNMSRFPF